MIRQKLWNPPISSALFNRSLNNCRPQCNGFHNTYRQSDLKHQIMQTDVAYHLLGDISLSNEDFKLFGKGRFESIKPKVKEQVGRMELVRHADTITHEKIITNDPTLYDRKNLTFKEKMDGMKADIEELKRASEESKRASEESKRALEEPKRISDQIVDTLERVMMLAHEHPGFFDILFDTIYGVPKNEAKLLLDADKTGDSQVYNILDDRGSAFHNHYANTCVKPFNSWLSAVRGLQDIQSATMNKSSSDHECYVRKQKTEVQKSIREWDAAFKEDEAKRDIETKKCQEMIWKDYVDRGLLPLIKSSIG